jgi:excinuclease ABC subunit C
MAYENAKLLLLDGRSKAEVDPLAELQRALGLRARPVTIEGMDVSNLQSELPVVSLVHFEDGKPLKAKYRLYYPRTVEGQNDFAMIHEAITRRFGNPENQLPHLLMIDGGKGQLQAAVTALDDLGRSLSVCSLAKAKTRSGFFLKDLKRSVERIFLPNRKNPVLLREGNPALSLLVQVRDEAHRFAITHHRKRRMKKMRQSPLTEIRGIGQKTRDKLLKKFGSVEAIKIASLSSLLEAGLTHPQAAKIREKNTSYRPSGEEE